MTPWTVHKNSPILKLSQKELCFVLFFSVLTNSVSTVSASLIKEFIHCVGICHNQVSIFSDTRRNKMNSKSWSCPQGVIVGNIVGKMSQQAIMQ